LGDGSTELKEALNQTKKQFKAIKERQGI